MGKTETVRQSGAAWNEKRLARLASQIESVRQANYQSAEELAQTLEPMAQAMAALTDETRQTLVEIVQMGRQHSKTFETQLAVSVKDYKEAAA